MKARKVISSKNLGTYSPIHKGLLWYLCLDYFNAPQWLYGVAGVLFVMLLINWIYGIYVNEKVDIFNNDACKPVHKSKFQERLEKAKNKRNDNK